jgi:hypothetical protein
MVWITDGRTNRVVNPLLPFPEGFTKGVAKFSTPKGIDMVGFESGKIKVIERDFSKKTNDGWHWKYKCSCGNTSTASGSDLRSGAVKGCGCGRKGQRHVIRNKGRMGKTGHTGRKPGHRKPRPLPKQFYWRLQVLSFAGYHEDGSTLWLCLCTCGKTCKVRRWNLVANQTKSCGCLRGDAVRNYKGISSKPGTAFRQLLVGYKQHAKEKKLEYSLTDNEFRALTSAPCFYCGAVPGKQMKIISTGEVYQYNGIDRKVNTEGYTTENSVTACWPCNSMKSSRNIDDFMHRILSIASKHPKYFNKE